MYILSIILMLFCTLKTIFYGIYELNENKNKSGGIALISMAILGFVLAIFLISI